MARIVVADDERITRTFLHAALTSAGHSVVVAEDGTQALAAVKRGRVDLVVTDLQMPKMDGLELIRALEDVSPRPPVVVLSGAGEQLLDEARAAGAVASLPKPVDYLLLMRTVAGALARGH